MTYWPKTWIAVVVLLTWITLIFTFRYAGNSARTLSNFNSDGCSMFPDQSVLTQEDWCECCFVHDLSYWKGGTKEERLRADEALRDCILEKTGNEELANLMFEGVRFGGSPYFYNWYRWGYGWSYDRKYQELTEAELQLVADKMRQYYETQPDSPCE